MLFFQEFAYDLISFSFSNIKIIINNNFIEFISKS